MARKIHYLVIDGKPLNHPLTIYIIQVAPT